ncbi:MAG: Gfo/Idh/MocA family protein [Pseudonocardiaceae bacterium]
MRTVRWGFLGGGRIAATMARAVRAAPSATLYAVASRDADRARALEPEGVVYTVYEHLIADPDVDAVYVALANDAHAEWTLAALAAGKTVLCEKPLGLNHAQARLMLAAGGLVAEALFYRWHPRIRLAERLVAEGAIGEVTDISSGFVFEWTGRPDNHRMHSTRGGGALYDVGCYPISAALWAFGGALPCDVGVQVVRGETGVDMAVEMLLAWPGGGTARLECGFTTAHREWLTVRGTEGRLVVPELPFTASGGPTEICLERAGQAAEVRVVPPVDPYQEMAEAFSAAVVGRPSWLQPHADSLACASVIDRLREVGSWTGEIPGPVRAWTGVGGSRRDRLRARPGPHPDAAPRDPVRPAGT